MPIQRVYAPVKGIITADPPNALDKEASPFIKGMYLRNGEVSPEAGLTQFPVAGNLKTNRLNGILLHQEEFFKSDGTSYLVGLTTTQAYQYNTSTSTWDCITNGQTIADCESAFTASANVTCTTSTSIKLRGSKSAKNAIGNSFTTGLAAYQDFSNLDLSAQTGVHFWIYVTTGTSLGDLQLLLDDTSGCVSPLETLNIPALSPNIWYPIYLPYADPSLLTSIISVGLKLTVDFGVFDIYLDDIRSVKAFTGDADNLFSTAVMNDNAIVTNGIDQPQRWDFSAAGFVNATTTLAAGSISSSEVVLSLKDHLIYFNNIENGASAPQRGSWTNIGSISDLINGTAGYQDLTGDNDFVVAAKKLSEDTAAVYMSKSNYLCTWVGGQTPFRFTKMTPAGVGGASSKASVIPYTSGHLVIGPTALYSYLGGGGIEEFDQKIRDTFYNSINHTYINRIFAFFNQITDEVTFYIPSLTTYPDSVWIIEDIHAAWYRSTRASTSFGFYSTQSTKTIGDLTGTIGEQNYRIGDNTSRPNTPILLLNQTDDSYSYVYFVDSSTLNSNGSAITNEFQTPDFTMSDAEGDMDNFFRATQLLIEAKGQSIEVHYSADSGNSWSPAQGGSDYIRALTGNYDIYQFDFDSSARKIRFRFRNTIVSSGFTFRYYSFKYLKRSQRR